MFACTTIIICINICQTSICLISGMIFNIDGFICKQDYWQNDSLKIALFYTQENIPDLKKTKFRKC